MIRFSDDPKRAEEEMHAVLFYLTTFGHVDGDFDDEERGFVRATIRRLIEGRARAAMPDAAPDVLADVVGKYTRHFEEVFEGIDAQVRDLFTESVSSDEDPKLFVHTRLKVRCFEIFQTFDRAGQENLLELIDQLILADGEAHPAEVEFRGELAELLEGDLGVELVDAEPAFAPIALGSMRPPPAVDVDHPFLKPNERRWSEDRAEVMAEMQGDLALVAQATALLEAARERGKGLLAGARTLAELAGKEPGLDGHVHVRMPRAGERYDLLVFGDLHGCYSVLKAGLLQSRFFEKVDQWRAAPKDHPFPMVVFLGDYIDRGLFSLNGVLRTVLKLLVTAPDHVVLLRGNHEYYVEVGGTMYGGVKPAESINTLKPLVPDEVFKRYRALFEALPNVFLFDRTFFVHGGIPRDRSIKEKLGTLEGLNDADVRFQMMWSDPSKADVIPAALQEKNARFVFGRLQFRAFMQRIGATLLVRGHEKVAAGVEDVYGDRETSKLLTLFSSGGRGNRDLPEGSSYRDVAPKVLTMTWDDGTTKLTPWEPSWAAYNDPARNAFFA